VIIFALTDWPEIKFIDPYIYSVLDGKAEISRASASKNEGKEGIIIEEQTTLRSLATGSSLRQIVE
jgi:hypothetical protein